MDRYQQWILDNAEKFGLTDLVARGEGSRMSMQEMMRRHYPDGPPNPPVKSTMPSLEQDVPPEQVYKPSYAEKVKRGYPDGPPPPVASTMEPEYARIFGLDQFPEVEDMDTSKPLQEAAKKKKEEKK